MATVVGELLEKLDVILECASSKKKNECDGEYDDSTDIPWDDMDMDDKEMNELKSIANKQGQIKAMIKKGYLVSTGKGKFKYRKKAGASSTPEYKKKKAAEYRARKKAA